MIDELVTKVWLQPASVTREKIENREIKIVEKEIFPDAITPTGRFNATFGRAL